MDELVSIIMPAYNAVKTINQSIQSVVNQEYQNWELIVINDGSSDQTYDLMKQWSCKDTRIIIINNIMNKGVSYSRNKGMSVSKGLWIAFLDSDDLWTKDKLTIQLKTMKDNNHLFSFTGVSFIDYFEQPYPGIMEVKEKLTYHGLLKHNSISCSSVIMHHDLIQYASFEGDQMSEDFASWLNILKVIRECTGVNKPLLIYRISKNSKSSNKLKSALMGYRAYRHHGIKPLYSILYLISHLLNSLKKYKSIGKIS